MLCVVVAASVQLGMLGEVEEQVAPSPKVAVSPAAVVPVTADFRVNKPLPVCTSMV